MRAAVDRVDRLPPLCRASQVTRVRLGSPRSTDRSQIRTTAGDQACSSVLASSGTAGAGTVVVVVTA